MADAKSYRVATLRNWFAWARKARERGLPNAQRALRFLDAMPDGHPSLEGVTAEARARLRATLAGG